tara:strand:+ start:485 stop:1216 length:732 start_codon:yes stop_codon:yes gene_type:complete
MARLNFRKGLAMACVLTCSAVLAGSKSTAEEGWVPFTKDELHAYLSGKTQVWDPNGGAYYAPDGTLDTLWDGAREGGTWSVTSNGALCWHVASWGELECEAYFHVGNDVMYSYYGETGLASERQDGNTLDALAAGTGLVLDIDREFLTPDEAMNLVSGHTEFFGDDGAIYYASDHTMTTVWNGVRHSGTWSIDDDGGVCWDVPAWGEEPCRQYYEGEEGLMVLHKGRDFSAEDFSVGDATTQF